MTSALDRRTDQRSRRRTKQDIAAEHLRDAILHGRLRPGQRIRQQDVAGELGLSWTPIREAFRLLAGEGWITVQPNQGAVVTGLSLPDFEDIYQLRLLTEPEAAHLSAVRVDDPTIAELERYVRRLEAMLAARRLDWAGFLSAERALHATLYGAAGRPRLIELVMSLRDSANRYLLASIVLPDEPGNHVDVQRALLEAATRRDGDAAERVLRSALARVLERMRPVLAATELGSLGGS